MVYETLGCTNNEGDDTSANKSKFTNIYEIHLEFSEKNV